MLNVLNQLSSSDLFLLTTWFLNMNIKIALEVCNTIIYHSIIYVAATDTDETEVWFKSAACHHASGLV